jgi:cytochrome c oxidase assembly factor CtaG
MTFEPGPFAGLLALAVLYVRAVRVLGRRGFRVPAGQQAFWWAGFALLALAFLGPLDSLATKLVWAHMGQHVLMADIAAPLMMIGVRNPVLLFLLPRPILEPLARRRTLRGALARLRSPMVAIPVYTLVLYAWHLAPLFEAALRNPVVHALQHESFIVFSVLLWWPLIEPNRRQMPGQLWKIPYVFAARLPTMFLGMGFIFSESLFYDGFYGNGVRQGGLSALTDQQLGGGIMMIVDVLILMTTLTVVFWRSASDDDAQAPVDEAGAQGHLAGVHQEGDAQPGMKVAEVR